MQSRQVGVAGNRLGAETSPYLRQHAHNPVHWQPWDGEALATARSAGKPILLSIGYSACHWCHVMAHESFEDEATAALMNREFINIKVDREERPDLDKIYQIAQQMITQHGGGWPLTMFLTPDDHTPFFGGTYFPRLASHGLPAFTEILQRVAQYFHANREQIRAQKGAIEAAFAQLSAPPATDAPLDDAPLRELRARLAEAFDRDWGGFGRAPKFPEAGAVENCLRAWARSSAAEQPDLHALYMASLTLMRMADGGLQDQLGGGFFRYSTDAHWMIPHFEKMLYDNAALLALYSQAALATGEAAFADVARATAQWALRDMRDPQGGFYSALDADSEGREGQFYVFSREQVRGALQARDFAPFARRFGLDREPNFEGHWHLHACESLPTLAQEFAQPQASLAERLDAARAALLAVRGRRPAPARDDKILTAWNGLMIKALALASRALEQPELEQAATAAVDFLHARAWRDGRLQACVAQGQARFDAYLDDHAMLADGLLELLQCRWRSADHELLVRLLEALVERFEDREHGGFFFTAHDHETLFHRVRSFADESLPAGNAVAAAVLHKAGSLLGEPRYLQAAERTLRAGLAGMREQPRAHAAMINALQDHLAPLQVVIVRGPAAATRAWVRELSRLYAPQRLLFAIADEESRLPASLAAKPSAGAVCAYVCTGTVCGAPISDFAQLMTMLRQSAA